MEIKQLVDGKNLLGEGPLWDVAEGRIYWIDSYGKKIFRAAPDGSELETWEVPDLIGSMTLRQSGGAVISLKSGFHFFDFATGACDFITDPEPDLPTTRLNDGKVDRRGRFLAGSMDMTEKSAAGSLYRLDPDLTCHKLDDGIMVSNGPCWSPDGGTFYFTDTWSGDIWAYDYALESGELANKRVFATCESADPDDSAGVPDGSTVDEVGFVWNALVYAGEIIRYAPDGSVDRRIHLPVKIATSVMFGGADLDILYVTSIAKSPQPQFPNDGPLGGSLFAIHGLGVRGIEELRFAG